MGGAQERSTQDVRRISTNLRKSKAKVTSFQNVGSV